MKFIQTETSFNTLIDIFNNSRNNIYLIEIINSILEGLNNKHSHKNSHKNSHSNDFEIRNNVRLLTKTKKINKTLRMTCLESKIFIKNSI